MINFLFLTVPIGTTYQTLKQKLQFPQDNYGVSNWVMNFPLTIYSSDLTEKHIFTDGCVQVSRCSTPNLQQRWKYFVMTRANGNRYYCTSHVFYQKSPILKKQSSTFVNRNSLAHTYSQFYLPKCLILMSEHQYFKIQTNLIKIYRQLQRNNYTISHQVNCWLYDNYQRIVLQGRKQQWNNLDIKPQGRSFTCPIQIAFNYYIQACNSHTLGSAIYWSKETKMQILHLYKLPKSSLFQFNYFFHLPISGQTLIVALAAILQQKQLIFTSYNQNSNVMLIQTLLSMIMPLKWNFLYVPNLPQDMIQAAKQCFMPMIVGIHKKYIHLLTDKTDKIIIHVDTNSVQGKQYLHQLPVQLYRFLKAIPLFTTNRRYLDWQKDVRIYSILMISQMLSDSFFLNQKQTNNWIQRKKGKQRYFYQQFASRSMMYQKLKQDTQDPLYQQESFLLRLNPKQRQQFLYNKFNKLLMEINYPIYHDNQKQWIKYYYNHNQKRKKLKDFKKSLIFQYSSSSSTNQSQMSSKNSSIKKLQIGGRKIGFTHSTVRL